MKAEKVAIIGAGICGLYLSRKLAEKGHRVTVFEKRNEVGKKACSGLFSKRILDFIPESFGLVENEIDYVLIHFPKRTLRVGFSKSFLLMSHCDLDKLEAEKAKKAGVNMVFNKTIESLSCLNDYDRIIGCDGPGSLVRKMLKLPDPYYRLGIIGFIEEKNTSNFVETWPVKSGFIWKIPRGRETEYGIMAENNEAKKLFDGFLKEKGIVLNRIEAGLIPHGLRLPRHGLITLCGDASGLTKFWSGGGVIWGLRTADILLKNFPDFSKYAKETTRVFCFRIILSRIAVKIVYFLGNNIPWVFPKRIKIESDYLF